MIDAPGAGEGYKKTAKRFYVPISTVGNVTKKWKLTATAEVETSLKYQEKYQRELLVGWLEKQVRTPV